MGCKFRKMLAVAMAAVSITASAYRVNAAYSYKDVPASHWAYTAISEISDKGLMVGDSTGYFKPNDYIDKFNTSKILAKAAGYKYTNVTAEEKIYFDRAYEKNKALLSQYQKAYSKWNSSADREIAYLLEKEILTVDDLNQFVLKDEKGEQQLRALSRQEAAVFMVRIMGRKTEALAGAYSYDYADDEKIGQAFKPYVYYLKNISVMAGDTDGNFMPNGAVVRASMAVMLNRVVSLMEGSASYATSTNAQQQTSGNKIESISGTIDKFYPEFNGIQILTGENKKIYKISPNVTIYVDSYLKTLSDLKEGMQITGVVNNNEVISVQAQSVTTSSTVAAGTNIPLSTIEGIVDLISVQIAGNTIGIEVRMNSPSGGVVTEVRSYVLATGCTIARGDEAIAFGEITKGEVVTAQISGSKCYSVKLEPMLRSIVGGTLSEKKYITASETPLLVIKDSAGGSYELRVTEDSSVYRNSVDSEWNLLRIGDTIDVTCEYDAIRDLYAKGLSTVVEGYLEELHITRTQITILIKNYSNEYLTYNITGEAVDVYSLRIGMRLSLTLDSKEVYSIRVLSEPTGD